jgi:hypothetical protein
VFSHDYVLGIKRESRHITDYASMLTGPSDVPGRLRTDLLYAEAGQFVNDPTAGNAWIDAANGITERAFAAVTPPDQVFTLTSRSTSIPLVMHDPGAHPLRVIVQLQSAGLTFPSGDSRTITLSRPNQFISFPVQLTSSGAIQIQVIVKSPSGKVVGVSQSVVHSTAYNRVALIVTLLAGLGLVALWARRFLKRRTT